LTGFTPVKYASFVSIENLTGQAGLKGYMFWLSGLSRHSFCSSDGGKKARTRNLPPAEEYFCFACPVEFLPRFLRSKFN
jgi:hypothetical protein